MTAEYYVVMAGEPETLAAAVNVKIGQGWEPFGGVAVASHYESWEGRDGSEHETVYTYSQAMTRRAGHPSGCQCPRCYGGPG